MKPLEWQETSVSSIDARFPEHAGSLALRSVRASDRGTEFSLVLFVHEVDRRSAALREWLVSKALSVTRRHELMEGLDSNELKTELKPLIQNHDIQWLLWDGKDQWHVVDGLEQGKAYAQNLAATAELLDQTNKKAK